MDIDGLYKIYCSNPSICTDTRTISEGDLYFALKGENFNGNRFADEALRMGASYAIVDESEFAVNERTLLVGDVLSSLQRLSTHHRMQLDIPVIGITGSNGKTTTKELVRDALGMKYRVAATRGNLNNHIGVPLTLLELTHEHEVAIVEMGANHVGEIELLCSFCRPTHGMITNIGTAHIGEFGGRENIIKGKTELYEFLRNTGGVVFVNGDDQLLSEKSSDIDHISYGTGALLDFQGRVRTTDPFLSLELRPDDELIETELVGGYNFSNAMAAACIADHFQVVKEDIIAAISSYVPENNRSQLVQKNGRNIIMDAYNANPDSMMAALENFSMMSGSNKLVILGEMKEMGEYSYQVHHELVQKVRELGFSGVFIGHQFSEHISDPDLRTYDTTTQAKEEVARLLESHDTVLIKGSRGVRLEELEELF